MAARCAATLFGFYVLISWALISLELRLIKSSAWHCFLLVLRYGEGEIRTPVRCDPKSDFESDAFNHSATSPNIFCRLLDSKAIVTIAQPIIFFVASFYNLITLNISDLNISDRFFELVLSYKTTSFLKLHLCHQYKKLLPRSQA